MEGTGGAGSKGGGGAGGHGVGVSGGNGAVEGDRLGGAAVAALVGNGQIIEGAAARHGTGGTLQATTAKDHFAGRGGEGAVVLVGTGDIERGGSDSHQRPIDNGEVTGRSGVGQGQRQSVGGGQVPQGVAASQVTRKGLRRIEVVGVDGVGADTHDVYLGAGVVEGEISSITVLPSDVERLGVVGGG